MRYGKEELCLCDAHVLLKCSVIHRKQQVPIYSSLYHTAWTPLPLYVLTQSPVEHRQSNYPSQFK